MVDERASLPDFLIVGAARSGTTALYQHLVAHPQLFLTEPKEPHFFAFRGTVPSFTGPGDRETINRLAVTDRDAYVALYRAAGPDQVRGEASVSTMYYPDAVDRVRADAPDARLICLLRDPVDRAFSAYSYMRTRGWETCTTFEDALADESRRVAAGWHHIWHYTRMSRYGEQVRHLLDVFPRNQVLVLRHEDLTADPDAVIGRVHEFIGVSPMPGRPIVEANRSGETRNRFVGRVMSTHHPLKKVVSPVVPAGLRRRLRRVVERRNLLPTTCRADTRRGLVEMFRPDLNVLENATGWDVSDWLSPERRTPGDR